jgi:hypothetical protein
VDPGCDLNDCFSAAQGFQLPRTPAPAFRP